MKLSSELCQRIDSIRELSEQDKSQIQNLMLDFFSAQFAGYKQNIEFNERVEQVIFEQDGKQEASVLFQSKKYPAKIAAFMNSLYGHGAELDDGNKRAMGHIGVHVIPAVLSLAEAEAKSMDEILLAIAAGYEAYIRISSSAQPGMVERSFHSTGFAGAPACAVACAKLLGLNATGIEDSMSLACTMASGLLTYSESQQMIKPINPAKAAETGVFAARLAEAGIQGPKECLEGPNGWLHAATEKYSVNMLVDEFEHLLIHECYFKLYPSCRHTHCGIDAAIAIHNQTAVSDIEKINVYIYPNAIKLAGQIMYPENADETKFSIHYTLACALLFGEYGVDYMNPPRLSAEVKEMIKRIELIPDAELENRMQGIRGTRIKAIMKNGDTITETVLVPKGDPENPLSREDLYEKLLTCSKGLLSIQQANKLAKYVCSFEGGEVLNTDILFCKK